MVAEGSASGELLGEQDPERGSRAGMNSGPAGQGRGRRGVGREKTSPYRRAKAVGISQKINATGQGAQMRKAQAKLGTGESSTHSAALGGDRDSSTGSTHCPASLLFL